VLLYNRFGGDNVVEYLSFSAILSWGTAGSDWEPC